MKKSLLLVPFVLLAMTPAASAQEICQNQFSSCVTTCVKDKPPTMQDRCIEVCQSNNNACYSKHNGLVQPQPDSYSMNPAPDGDSNANALAAEDPTPAPVAKKKPAPKKSEPKDRRSANQR